MGPGLQLNLGVAPQDLGLGVVLQFTPYYCFSSQNRTGFDGKKIQNSKTNNWQTEPNNRFTYWYARCLSIGSHFPTPPCSPSMLCSQSMCCSSPCFVQVHVLIQVCTLFKCMSIQVHALFRCMLCSIT